MMERETTEPPEDSALAWARAWLEAVITSDPEIDAAVWRLTHESWRCRIAGAFLGDAYADLGRESDVTILDDWQDLARFAVLQMREALPHDVVIASGKTVHFTQHTLPLSLDRVEVIFTDTLAKGWHHVNIGERVGFAMTMVRQESGWTVESIERDWVFPEWLSEG